MREAWNAAGEMVVGGVWDLGWLSCMGTCAADLSVMYNHVVGLSLDSGKGVGVVMGVPVASTVEALGRVLILPLYFRTLLLRCVRILLRDYTFD
jgi:hypothetical protein